MPPRNLTSKDTNSGNILKFFKPVSVSTSQPGPPSSSSARQQTPPQASSSAFSGPPSPSPLPPSPSSFKRASVTTPTRLPVPLPDEIAASDDDENEDGHSSDDSLEDLSTLLGRSRNLPSPPKPHLDPFSTPRAKRAGQGFHASPLAVMTKHRFDMKTLANDAKKDDATTASSMRVKAAAEEAKTKLAASTKKSERAGHGVAEIVGEKGGQDARKVLRAVQRSEAGKSQPRFCFFDPDYRTPPSKRPPKEGNNGPWRLLTEGTANVREQHLASGLPQSMVRKMACLPDPLFEWILDELCTQTSVIMRQEYCDLIAHCPDQVERLVTPERLEHLFIRLGANKHLGDKSKGMMERYLDCEPYQDRDWSCLRSFLALLTAVSGHLSVPAVQYAMRTLLAMSMDKFLICNMDALMAYEAAIQHLAGAMPRSSWDSFCSETCSSLCTNIASQSIRANALLCLPVSNRRTHDLRRRLAVVFLFKDTSLGRYNGEDTVTLLGLTNLLAGDDFAINADTDFSELKASVIMLDMAIDDGSAASFDDAEEEAAFNRQVDELASRLREIWRKINDSGMKLARTEAKSVVEWVQQRLSNEVRTRRMVKKSIFDLPGQGEEPSLPRQQDFVKRFLQRPPKSPRVDADCIVVAVP
ncbi:hypothetical protein RJ55_06099 [Drechmeria coniospora]|nr:hypothetical protein RJ55_06099 [Drechmeria coniospora]